MHSSRMRTARLRVVAGGGGRCSDQVSGVEGVDILTWSRGGGGRCSDLVPCCIWCATYPPGLGQTNACENITFATRAVISYSTFCEKHSWRIVLRFPLVQCKLSPILSQNNVAEELKKLKQ